MALYKTFPKTTERLLETHEVVQREHEIINARRKVRLGFAKNITNPQHVNATPEYLERGVFSTIGLALSGGGIRSAAFCLGVMQALAKQGIMKQVDYLSTVSGGGYIGAAASLNMARDGQSFPFVDATDLKDSDAVKVLRDRTNYLRVGEIASTLESITIYVRGVVANLLFVLPVLLVLAAFTLLCNPDWPAMRAPDIFGWALPGNILQWNTFGVSPYAILLFLVLFAVWGIAIVEVAAAGVNSAFLVKAKYLLPVLGFIIFMELQPYLLLKMTPSDVTYGPPDPAASLIKWLIGLVTPVLTFVALVSKYIGDLFKAGQGQTGWIAVLKQSFGSTIVWLVAGLLLPLLLWMSYLLLVFWGVPAKGCSIENCFQVLGLPISKFAVWYTIAAVVMFLCSLLLKPNSNSPHRLYRDRLARAFCEPLAGRDEEPQPAAKLSDLDGNGPYHIINTTLNVQADEDVNQRGRNGEFFVFSPEFIGSHVTKFAATKIVEEKLLPELDLATAVAISGAAASSNMGSESIRPLRFTLAFFNVRLGYWFPNVSLLLGQSLKPTFMYFLKEITGSLKSQQNLLYLTDGGHIENLGVYELLRRRCKVIFAVDGEADPEMNFGALVKLQRYARIDFGTRIDLKWSDIKKQSLDAQKVIGEPRSGPHCAIGKIKYENGDPGVLVYIKSSVTGDENDYVRDYNRRYRAFPHETTADQFFNEEQFEVYRALGFHTAYGMLEGEHDVQVLDDKDEVGVPPRLARMFGVNADAFGLAEIRGLLVEKVKATVKIRSTAGAPQSKRRSPTQSPKST